MKILSSKTILVALIAASTLPAVAQVNSASKMGLSSKVQSSQGTKMGVSNGGGGTVVVTSDGRHLLDLVLHSNDFRNSSAGITLPSSRAMEEFGLDTLDYSQVKNEILAKLERTKSRSPIMSEFISQAVNSTPVFFAKAQIGWKDPYYFIPSERRINPANLQTAAVYLRNIGTVISQPIFDSLNFKSQMGLIVHEVLRQVQLTYGLDISNATLQDLTARVIAEDSNLDDSSRVDGKLKKFLQERVGRYNSIADQTREFVVLAKKLNVKIPEGAYDEQSLNAMISSKGPQIMSPYKIFPRGEWRQRMDRARSDSERNDLRKIYQVAEGVMWAQFANNISGSDLLLTAISKDLDNTFSNLGILTFLEEVNQSGLSHWPFSDFAKEGREFDRILFGSGFLVKSK